MFEFTSRSHAPSPQTTYFIKVSLELIRSTLPINCWFVSPPIYIYIYTYARLTLRLKFLWWLNGAAIRCVCVCVCLCVCGGGWGPCCIECVLNTVYRMCTEYSHNQLEAHPTTVTCNHYMQLQTHATNTCNDCHMQLIHATTVTCNSVTESNQGSVRRSTEIEPVTRPK